MTFTDRPTPNQSSRGTTRPDLIVIHDEEGDSVADNLGRYLQGSSVQASYHLIVDKDGNVCRGVPDTAAAWAAGPIANSAGLHLCFTGRAAWSREQWLARPAQMAAAAQLVADWSRTYGIPLVHRTVAELNSAAGTSGVVGHIDVAAAWRETTHTDPGTSFPWDVLIDRASALLRGVSTSSVQEDDGMATNGETIIDQLLGYPQDDAGAPKAEADGGKRRGWKQLGWRSLVDAVAVLLTEATQRLANRVDYKLLGENEPTQRPTDTVLGYAINADARAYEARQIGQKNAATLARVEAKLDALTKKAGA
ncbi:hypothetical protein GCM10027047_01750 [Rhodococcus aerolatus]